ncbi:MAG: alkaline phosphatase [Neisseria sp.]|nr:alkaline phosphatase [Neisseria sp.]
MKKVTLLAMSMACAFSIPAQAAELLAANTSGKSQPWFADGQARVQQAVENAKRANIKAGKAKNVILFVGDGMGISTVTATRILEGQQRGQTGEENLLSFEKFPFSGLSKTYNTNQQTPDSAGTMTAIVTGVKTKAGLISIGDDSPRASCSGQKGHELTTALELAHQGGKSTGVVTTARLTHATPAATYAKISDRDWESNDNLPEEAVQNGCKDIAQQFVDTDAVDVAFGGGRRHFLPKEVTDSEGKTGKRTDGQNLVQVWQGKTGGVYVEDEQGFRAIPDNAKKVLGLFNSSHMQYESDRKNDKAGEPSLTEMTEKAIKLLSNNKNGYFLMVESGRVDHGHHAGNAYNALNDAVELSRAVEAAKKMTNDKDTLIIVTADHSHVFTIAGYPTRGNPILGKVVGNDKHGQAQQTPSLAADNLPYTTLGYTNGNGFRNYGSNTDAEKTYTEKPNGGRHDLTAVDTTMPGFHQEALVPLDSETHGAEDVGIYASGPGAALLTGVVEQNTIFHVMDHAAGLSKKARR